MKHNNYAMSSFPRSPRDLEMLYAKKNERKKQENEKARVKKKQTNKNNWNSPCLKNKIVMPTEDRLFPLDLIPELPVLLRPVSNSTM